MYNGFGHDSAGCLGGGGSLLIYFGEVGAAPFDISCIAQPVSQTVFFLDVMLPCALVVILGSVH
jgi:hypothetical protein